MSGSTTMVECPNLQASLDQYFQTCNSRRLFEPAPLFEFLNSDFNRGAANYSALLAPGEGKVRTAYLTYTQRILESAVTTPGTTRNCAATTQRGNLSTHCDIDTTAYEYVEEKIVNTDFRRVCESNGSIVAGKMLDMISALERKVATKVTTQAVALIGGVNSTIAAGDKVTVNSGINVGETYLKIATKKSAAAGGDIDPTAFATLDYLAMQNALCNNAPIFGGEIFRYAQLMRAGCCANTGISLEKIMDLYPNPVFYDKRVWQAMGSINDSIMIQPGALQIVWFNENNDGIANAAGITVGTNYQKQIIYSPNTGIPIDLTMKDDCGTLHINMYANPKLCGLPYDLFATGDEMEGETFVYGVRIVNPA